MIRRKFMKFAPKEHDDEKVKKTLEKHNVPTFEGTQPSKFGQFSTVAKDIASKSRKNIVTPEGGHVASAEKTFSWQQQAIYGGGGGPQPTTSDPRNPYAVVQPKTNPYARQAPAAGPNNPYGGGGAAGNPYGGPAASANPYGGGASAGANPYGGPSRGGSAGADELNAGAGYGDRGSNLYPAPSVSSRDRSAGPSFQSGDTYAYDGGSAKDPLASATDSFASTGSGSTYHGAGAGAGAGAAAGAGQFGRSASSATARPHKAAFDEPDGFGVPLTRTQTSQTTTSVAAARQELFGAAPRASRKLSSFGEDDELNQTPDELDGPMGADTGTARVPAGVVPLDDDELNHDPEELERGPSLDAGSRRYDAGGQDEEGPGYGRGYGLGGGPGYGAGQSYPQAYGQAPGPNYDPQAAQAEADAEDEDVDELNQLPSELSNYEAPVHAAPQGYRNYGEVHQHNDYDDEGPGYVTGDQIFGEEQDSEDEDVEYVKREIRQTKQESVESTRRALQIANEAETSGRNALGMLGDQGERLGNSARTVQLGSVQARVADENADELMRLNRSIFIPNVSNPFNSRRRNQMKAAKLQGQQVYDQLEREELERLQRESEQRVSSGLNGSGVGYSETALRVRQRMNRDNPQRKMYQFEADSDDDALEDELDQNLDGMQDAAKRLHQLSLNIHGEVGSQNRRIEQMGGRVDDLDHRLHKSTAKMATIN